MATSTERRDPAEAMTEPRLDRPRGPLERLIALSLRRRGWVMALAAALLLVGGVWVATFPVDIFPDLTAPTVTIITEARGLAPEEVELLVSFPIESAVNGAPGVRRIRSVSADGISVIWVEFAWGEDVYRARQVVTERLQRVELPVQAESPELGPISSILGEITFVALTTEELSQLELRRLADVVVRRALLALPGVSQVVTLGGDIREVRIEVEPSLLVQHRVSLQEVLEAAEGASRSAAAGFHVDGGQEYLVHSTIRARGPEDLEPTAVAIRDGRPVRLSDLGRVTLGPAPARGVAAYRARPAVVLSIQKQPNANTLELTRQIDATLARLQATLPSVTIETENFRQSDFIETAIGNVSEALRDGSILVVLVLLLFLGSWRGTLISALAIPLSLVAGIVVVRLLGGTINTMTLGGLTIAIGALVDDAIIDVENVFRRLRLEHRKPADERRSSLEVVFTASSEVRQAILFATLIIALVFVPLFFLPGIEGRLLRPLGIAYVAALAASFLVSLTVTPALASLLLPHSRVLGGREPWLLRTLHRLYEPSLGWALRHRRTVLATAALAVVLSATLVPGLGRSFLPSFTEGSLTVSAVSAPGIPLTESDDLGGQVERLLLEFPEVVSTSRRTGRAEKDEHVQGVNASEIEVVLRGVEGRRKEELLAEMRSAVAVVPGVDVSFGQPISHRIDHMLSGSRTNLAVKVFGPDLTVLRSIAGRVREILDASPEIVDVSNQEQAPVPRLVVDLDRAALARFGIAPAAASRAVESLFQGTEVGEIVEDGVVARVVVRLPERLRRDADRLGELPLVVEGGKPVRLDDVAELRFELGPSLVRRENVERIAMVTANVAHRDLAGAVLRVQEQIDGEIDLPEGYGIDYGGQFEEAVRSSRTIAMLSVVLALAMYLVLFVAFRHHRDTLIVLVNLPLALIGGIVAVALGDGILSIATLVGFVTLFGIATRNGVLLVTHYQHLVAHEGLDRLAAVVRGSRERLAPVLMTALTAGLALLPLILAGEEPGNEIQSPMARVILGGLLSSTFLNLVLVPVLWVGAGSREDRRTLEEGSATEEPTVG